MAQNLVDDRLAPARVWLGQFIFSAQTLMAKNPTGVRPLPDQCDVNCLASFTEAAEELQREPFFSGDNKTTLAKQSQTGETQFGNRFHFRSALISFRRIRNEREAANFLEICRLLKRFNDGDISVEAVQQQHKELTERRWPNLPLAAGGLVDLWLDAMFEPTRLKNPRGERCGTRIEFGRLVKAHGHAFVENGCRTSISAIGTCYFALLKVARLALGRWEKDYELRPEFEIGIPSGLSLVAASGAAPAAAAILSSTAGPLGDESPLQKFERVLATDQFKPLKAVLDSLQLDPLVICEAVKNTNSYQELMGKLGYKIILEPQIHYQDCYSRVGRAGGIRAVLPYHDTGTHSTLVTLANFNLTLTTTPKTAAFFNLRFAELKTLLKS